MKKSKYPLVEALKKYFKETPKEQLDKDWEEAKFWNEFGSDVSVYCKQNWKRYE